ncbi:hypothetical protein C8R44DRAFT_893630 [Mycena epipterygia]|nr:hypothetical protein C8R44DRAFT_893630 [Mycena epipterygia]
MPIARVSVCCATIGGRGGCLCVVRAVLSAGGAGRFYAPSFTLVFCAGPLAALPSRYSLSWTVDVPVCPWSRSWRKCGCCTVADWSERRWRRWVQATGVRLLYIRAWALVSRVRRRMSVAA